MTFVLPARGMGCQNLIFLSLSLSPLSLSLSWEGGCLAVWWSCLGIRDQTARVARCPCLVGPVFGLRWRKCTWAINEMGGRATSRGDSIRFTISGSPSRRSGLGIGSFLRKVFTLPQYMYCYSQGTRSPTPNPDLGGAVHSLDSSLFPRVVSADDRIQWVTTGRRRKNERRNRETKETTNGRRAIGH